MQKKSLARGRNVWEVLRNRITIRRKWLKAKSKGYKLDGIVLLMRKKHFKQWSQKMVLDKGTLNWIRVYNCHLKRLKRELTPYTLIRMVVTHLRNMNSIVLVVATMKQSQILMKIMILGTNLKVKVYSFPSQLLIQEMIYQVSTKFYT